jgi:hypothetical protein
MRLKAFMSLLQNRPTERRRTSYYRPNVGYLLHERDKKSGA